MGFNDGVSKLWVMRAERGLDIKGYDGEVGAIGALIRHLLVRTCNTRHIDEVKAEIMAGVEKALRHMDEVDDAEPLPKWTALEALHRLRPEAGTGDYCLTACDCCGEHEGWRPEPHQSAAMHALLWMERHERRNAQRGKDAYAEVRVEGRVVAFRRTEAHVVGGEGWLWREGPESFSGSRNHWRYLTQRQRDRIHGDGTLPSE